MSLVDVVRGEPREHESVALFVHLTPSTQTQQLWQGNRERFCNPSHD
jgi:hypothetical protein